MMAGSSLRTAGKPLINFEDLKEKCVETLGSDTTEAAPPSMKTSGQKSNVTVIQPLESEFPGNTGDRGTR